MRSLLQHTLMLVFVVGLSAQASNLYPEWFLYPGKYPHIVVGYTYNGAPEIIDAQNMYCAYNECVVLGTLEIFQHYSENDYLKNSDYFYYYSLDSVESNKERFYPVDRFCISTLTEDFITAYTLDSAQAVEAPRLELQNIAAPEWLEKDFWEDEEFYYGVGIYTSTGGEPDAWKTAEEHAIFKILTNLAVEVHKLRILGEGEIDKGKMEQISFLKVKYLLRDIKILERYPDRDNYLFYTKVRIPKESVISPFLN